MNLTCRVVQAQPEFVGKQGHLCSPAISAETVGARKIHLQIVRIPAGGVAMAHKHEGHETALHIISGESGMWYGDNLEQHLVARVPSINTDKDKTAASMQRIADVLAKEKA